MRPYLFVLLISGSPLEPSAQAQEKGDFLKLIDPPNTINFQFVKIKEIRIEDPSKKNLECHQSFRADMNKSLKDLWQQCHAVTKTESSPCQRALFEKCSRFSSQIQEIETNVCNQLNRDGALLTEENHSQITRSQNTAQKSDQHLNLSAEEKTLQLLKLMKSEESKIESLKRISLEQIQNPICAESSELKAYQSVESRISKSLQKAKGTLISFSKIKTLEAQQESAHQIITQKQLIEMKSLTPPLLTNNIRSQNQEPAAPESNNTASPITSVLPIAAQVLPFFDSQTPKVISLQRIAASPQGKQRGFLAPPGAPIPDDADFSETIPNSSDETNPDGAANMESLNLDPEEKLARKFQISIDRKFIDRERIKILHGISLIPDCYHPQLRGLKIARNTKLEVRGNSCVAGLYHVGKAFIEMSPRCNGIQVGVTVHEIFHHLAYQKQQLLQRQYSSRVFQKIRGCPVSRYAQTDGTIHEDLAESGRLIVFPPSGQKLGNRCVQVKLDEMANILDQCK